MIELDSAEEIETEIDPLLLEYITRLDEYC